MKTEGERPLAVDLLLAVYLLMGLIVLTVGVVALSDDTSSVADQDMVFIEFFMILGSVLSLLVFLFMFKGKSYSWHMAAGLAIVKLVYCLFMAATVPDRAGVLAVAFIEVLMLCLIMSESTRDYLLG